jgi:hypothetical protein
VRAGAFVLAAVLVAVATACGGHEASPTRSLAGAAHTLGDLDPPHLTITRPAHDTAPGWLFIAPKGGRTRDGGPVIADNEGRIRWYHQLPHPLEATDFRTQTYRGKPVLTWWQGTISKAGIGKGVDEIYDASYRHIATVEAGNGLQADLHEFQLTPRGTAFITVYHEVAADLSSVGGPQRGYALDSVVQEIDVASGRVVWEWHSLGHVPLADSLEADHEPAKNASQKRPLDYFHVNSVGDGPNGTVIISARNVSAIYLIARDGHIVWQLGGKRSDFGPKKNVTFFFQHDARLHPGSILTFFDDGGIPRLEKFSRSVELKLDVARKTATIVKVFKHTPKGIPSPYEGNMQLLPDGGAVVGWGGVRKVTEFAPNGDIRFEVLLPFGDTYRAYRLPFRGRPTTRPLAAVAGNTVYASWNGSTAVATWEVDADGTKAASAPWNGLETAIPARVAGKKVVVRALDAGGRELGRSAPVNG